MARQKQLALSFVAKLLSQHVLRRCREESAKELEPGTYALSGINLRDSPLLCQAKLDAPWVSL